MHAFDSPPVPQGPLLSDSVRSLLHDAIVAVYRSDVRSEDALADALRQAATEAHERGLHAEQLVIDLKEILDDVCRGVRGGRSRDDLALRDRIVAACIRAYFRTDGAAHTPAPPRRRVLIDGIIWTISERVDATDGDHGADPDRVRVLEFVAAGQRRRELAGVPADWIKYSEPAVVAFWIEAGKRQADSA